MNFDLLGLDSFALRLRQTAGQMRPAPEYRGDRTQHPRDGADQPRIVILRRNSRRAIESIITDHCDRFHRRKDTPAELVRHDAQQLRHVQHRAYSYAGARQRQ